MENRVPNLIHCNKIADLISYLPKNCRIITIIDPVVEKLYGDCIPFKKIVVEASESNKSISGVEKLTLELLKMGADRVTFLLGVGGGIITDLTGFLASIYMRGIRFGFIPTTLLAQVDASIGGKNGVNIQGFKNIAGVFNKPEFILICKDFLETLPEKEIKGGLSEMLKTFLISDRDSFLFVTDLIEKSGYNTQKLSEWIDKAAHIKFSITERDPFDRGERELLNLGHTFAHALEKVCKISHGEAVAIGINIAVLISVRIGLLKPQEGDIICKGLVRCGLEVNSPIPVSSLADAIIRDKKKSGDKIRLVLLESAGKAISYPLDINILDKYLYDLS
ncbi:MAG: 3-dehydroquinate synthase [Bacteroidales bacterium]|nr:3-dehydroquinate synthase [Bacteroidales bacterium]MDD3990172.1 3-dehydroquinate synthase [Bacteroidales bacterium]MDD4639693.1 3-dehydroquinate synthase [Bacteroidales bacterium]